MIPTRRPLYPRAAKFKYVRLCYFGDRNKYEKIAKLHNEEEQSGHDLGNIVFLIMDVPKADGKYDGAQESQRAREREYISKLMPNTSQKFKILKKISAEVRVNCANN